MDSKRMILAMAVSLAILTAWHFLFPPPPPPEARAPAAQTSATAAAPEAPSLAAATLGQAAAAPATALVLSELSNDLVTFRLSNRGARVEEVALAKFADAAGPSGKPLRLLPGPDEHAGMMGLETEEPTGDVLYTLGEATPSRVTYVWRSPRGMLVEKTYSLEPGRYDLTLSVRLVNEGTIPLRDRANLRIVRDYRKTSSSYVFEGPAYLLGGSLNEVKPGDLDENPSATGNIEWVGTMDNYFIEAFLPDKPAEVGVVATRDMGIDNVARIVYAGAPFDLAPGQSTTFSTRFFAGPKQKEILAALGSNFDKALDYGWFSIIAVPLLIFLHWLYGVFGNYGVAILLLTAVIKLAFWPLSAKSYKSMARMKDLQPKVQKLKERYADDREKLNMEMMQLWKTHKVNPFSGCLPMLVQIPVFIALYRALMGSIELRHAPFVFWLTDLSAPDPYYITPVVMGLTMFLQQKMTPATGADEVQMKIMMYGMPVLFTWLFKDFASGLVIYWLLNNVLSIAQQWAMMRKSAKAAPAA